MHSGMSSHHQALRCWSRIAILAIVFANGILSSDANAGDELKWVPELKRVPQLVWSTRKGLDVRHNAIDRLIDTFGFICYRDRYSTRPCRIESELVAFLKRLPPNQTDISRELTALGATCETKDVWQDVWLNCVYERHVEESSWKADYPEPMVVADEFFRINLIVANESDSLRYDAQFKRTSTVKKRAPRYGRET
jgi:hypothetical protein